MINLLPPTEKKKLQRENRMRLSVLILWVALALEALVALLFLPSYYAVSANIKNLTMRLGEEKLLIPTGGEAVEATLKSIGEEVALLKPLPSDDTTPSELLARVLRAKPEGVVLRSFFYGKTNANLVLQFSGNADTREDLLAFQRNIEEDTKFGEVKYDQSFITKKTAIDFRLTVTVK